jgi:hypothetical protein
MLVILNLRMSNVTSIVVDTGSIETKKTRVRFVCFAAAGSVGACAWLQVSNDTKSSQSVIGHGKYTHPLSVPLVSSL